MDDRELAEKLLKDHFTASAALIPLMLKNLPTTFDRAPSMPCATAPGKIELRTQVESNETELVLVPADGTGCCTLRSPLR